jgi:hypothetical protein
MRRLALVSLLTAPACFTDAPSLDEAVEGSSSESDSGGLEESEGGSSSSGGEVDWMDAYGPCDVDSDCELVPGDHGDVVPGYAPKCWQGTCAQKCTDSNAECPGYFETEATTEPGTQIPFLCTDGWCSVTVDPGDRMGCPEGMYPGNDGASPDLGCVWQS